MPMGADRSGLGGVSLAKRKAVTRRGLRKATLPLAALALCSRFHSDFVLGFRRAALPTLSVSFPKQAYRIGEAANLGPYSEGGASSSASVAPFGMRANRSCVQVAVGSALAGDVAAGHTIEEPRFAAEWPAIAVGVHPLDDPDDWTFAEEHEAYEERPPPDHLVQCCPSPVLDAGVAEPEDH